MKWSISTRLIGIAAVTILALLPLFGYALSRAFLASVQSGFDRHVQAYLVFLAGRLESTDEGTLVFSREPGDDRFEQLHSGWYWQISTSGEVQKVSRSLWDEALAPPPATDRQPVEMTGPRGERLRGAMLRLEMRGLADPVQVLVTGPRHEIDDEVDSFNWLLFRSLGLLGLILIATLVAQIRWGLAPLRAMAESLRRVRRGDTTRLDVRLPADLGNVAMAMNEVLAHQEQLLARGRSVAGNLAHALKTPLAAIRLKIESLSQTQDLRTDLTQIQRIIDHHLTMAAAAGRAGGHMKQTNLRASIEPVIAAVRSLHAQRALRMEVDLPSQLQVAMDAQDLQELAGNLLDNAAQWARTQIRVHATHVERSVTLRIEDDGPGIRESERQSVLDRGLRLDERQPGSGLGLAIVKDLADLYGLAITLERADIGGLAVGIRFPSTTDD
jgi:signal transduction histidine kinase